MKTVEGGFVKGSRELVMDEHVVRDLKGKDFLVLTCEPEKFSARTFFPPKSRFYVYDLKPVVRGEKSVAEARSEVDSVMKCGVRYVNVDFIHKVKRALNMCDMEFWTSFFDLEDDSFRIVHVDLRGYGNFVLRSDHRDKFGVGDTDFTLFFRPGDIYIKNQLNPMLHDAHEQLFFVPYIAPYARSAFLLEGTYIAKNFVQHKIKESDIWFVGALTRKIRYDLVVRAKAIDGVRFGGGVAGMERLLVGGKMPDKFEGCDLQHSFSRVPVVRYLMDFGKTKVALSVRGVGKICIRMMEAMSLGTACLSDDVPLENMWLAKPVPDVHCFFYKSDWSDFEEQVRRVLENDSLRDEVAIQGHHFWQRYHRIKTVGIFGNTLLDSAYRMSKCDVYSEARSRIEAAADEDGLPKVF